MLLSPNLIVCATDVHEASCLDKNFGISGYHNYWIMVQSVKTSGAADVAGHTGISFGRRRMVRTA